MAPEGGTRRVPGNAPNHWALGTWHSALLFSGRRIANTSHHAPYPAAATSPRDPDGCGGERRGDGGAGEGRRAARAQARRLVGPAALVVPPPRHPARVPPRAGAGGGRGAARGRVPPLRLRLPLLRLLLGQAAAVEAHPRRGAADRQPAPGPGAARD